MTPESSTKLRAPIDDVSDLDPHERQRVLDAAARAARSEIAAIRDARARYARYAARYGRPAAPTHPGIAAAEGGD